MGGINHNDDAGDNLEFNIATAGDITCYFNGGSTGAKTSADDTATEKYTNTARSRNLFCLRPDQAVQIISINNTTFTNPMSCIKNSSITEKHGFPIITKMVIRILTDDTNIKLRVR